MFWVSLVKNLFVIIKLNIFLNETNKTRKEVVAVSSYFKQNLLDISKTESQPGYSLILY